jgi:hypothetical protein
MTDFAKGLVCLQAVFPPVVEQISVSTVGDEGLPPT